MNNENNKWPNPTFEELNNFYGEIGDPETYTRLELPYPMILEWNKSKTINRITINKACADSLGRVLEDVYETYGYREIKKLKLDHFSGSLNIRNKRGGSTPSLHSWAAAIDIFAFGNGWKTKFSDAQFSRVEYRPFLDCFVKENWNSLGLTRGFDAMHMEATKINSIT